MLGEEWNQFSENYDEKVFSLTKNFERRKQILSSIGPGKVLNLGCGSTHYLNKDLIKKGNEVVATDFCKPMLGIAEKKFSHPNLEYHLEDSRKLSFEDKIFENVVSINSILPPKREDIYQMGSEIYRVLKQEGVFTVFFPSYDSAKITRDKLGLELELNDRDLSIIDTKMTQCFHTPESIKDLMCESNFLNYHLKKVFLNEPSELSEIGRIYGVDTSKFPVYEYLVVAKK